MPFTDDPLNGFIRSLDAGGMVMGVTSSGSVVPQTLVSPRSAQQLFRSYQASADSSQCLECQSNNLFLQASTGGLEAAPEKSGDKSQQWWLSPDGHLSSEAMGDDVLAIRNGAYVIVPRDPNDVTQKFEFVYPAAEFYIRNSFTGFFLAADSSNGVFWSGIPETDDARLRWYSTPSQRFMNRATGKVLQARAIPGAGRARLALGDALAVGPGSLLQAFVVTSDRTLRCLAAQSLVVGGAPASVVLVDYSPSNPLLPIQLVSPFSFFLLQSNLPQPVGAPPVPLWLTFDGYGVATMQRTQTGGRGQLFAVSDFGQVFCAQLGQIAWINTQNNPPDYLRPSDMQHGSPQDITFRFEGEELPGGALGVIRIPANSQLLSVTLNAAGAPVVTFSPPVSNSSQATQYWTVIDPLNGAMRFFMEYILDKFTGPAAFPQ